MSLCSQWMLIGLELGEGCLATCETLPPALELLIDDLSLLGEALDGRRGDGDAVLSGIDLGVVLQRFGDW